MRLTQWIAIAGMVMFFPMSALAIDLGKTNLQSAGTKAGIDIASSQASLGSMVALVVNTALNLLGVILLVLFIYAGILWMTAQGEPKQVTKAKDIMKNALVGLVITLLAYSLSYYTFYRLGYTSLTDKTSFTRLVDTAGMAGMSAESGDLFGRIGYFVNAILNLLGIVIFLIFLYAGFLWMTAAGDPKQVTKAKDMMKNAAIGLLLVLMSRGIAGFVIDQLTTAAVDSTASTEL